jgi:hypothetical protein
MSDMHSGSVYSLFPDRILHLRTNKNHTPTAIQRKMYDHWKACAAYVKRERKGKNVILVHNGDAIEGVHHNSLDHITPQWSDHVQIHIELMGDFRKMAGITASDKMYYVSGTESHTRDEEGGIAEHFDAEPAEEIAGKVYRLHHELKLKINGREVWYTHHGANAGKGANEGNGLRNWMRDIYWDMKREGKTPPHMIYSSHFHKTTYTSYVQDYHTIHGKILPSWQQKTRYALRVAPFQRNDIGMSIDFINADGDIRIMPPMLL